jgi:hypothetical protein
LRVLLMTKPPANPKRSGLKAQVVVFSDEGVMDRAEPGQIEFKDGYLLLACPGCGHVGGMHFGPAEKPKTGPSWAITGNVSEIETVTLSPSINCIGCCGWHGYLTRGVFNSI